MRIVVYGAGAIGGVIGARLFAAGHDVVLIARGQHGRAMAESGLRVESPDEQVTLRIPVVDHPSAHRFQPGDVVVLAMKSHDTQAAVSELTPLAPADTPLICAQNGVENERAALRAFARVYGTCVMCPATYLRPGVVQAHSTPTTGILDTGRYPRGVDPVVDELTRAFEAATFSSRPQEHIMRWKYAKLLMNLANAAEALCGPAGRDSDLARQARSEGEACLRAAGIDFASEEEDRLRRADWLQLRPIDGARRGGGSSWQSLARGVGSIETDYLNGEIVLLGRLHGLPTPVNELLQREAARAAREGRPPGSLSVDQLAALIGA
jgi:2-dehydropantoate 2-reductase